MRSRVPPSTAVCGRRTKEDRWMAEQSTRGFANAPRTRSDFPVNLHRFRHAAASLWSVRDPKNVRGAKDLFGHSSFRTTEKHYVMAQSRLAGRALALAIGATIDHEPTGRLARLKR